MGFRPFVSKTVRVLFALGLATLISATSTDLEPNYATRLLPPLENSDYTPRLFPARHALPIRVAVVPDPDYVTEERLKLVREACGKWISATSTSPAGALDFEYVPLRGPRKPDVVISFCAMCKETGMRGLTLERGGWATISLAVTEFDGEPLETAKVRRVATHEIGHALGIWGHSPDPHDVMSLNEDAADVTVADVNTLRIAYGAKSTESKTLDAGVGKP